MGLFVLIIPHGLVQQIKAASALTAQTHRNSVDVCCTAHGSVKDPLGASVSHAAVELLDQNGAVVLAIHAGSDGLYQVSVPKPGQSQLRTHAKYFNTTTTPLRYFVTNSDLRPDLTLSTPTLTEAITVTVTPTPLAQVSTPVTILTSAQFPHSNDIQEPLRYIPGVQVTQAGQSGRTSGASIPGGATTTAKVFIDGVPANDICGATEFANISTVAIDRIEVLRGPNSALYGSDALAGVVSLPTRRGSTVTPRLDYSADGGNFSSYRQEAALSGVVQRLDYLADFGRQDTHNSIPSNTFHYATFASNFGYQLNSTTAARLTYRNVATSGGKPNAILLYGIPDAAGSKEQDQYVIPTQNNQTTDRWRNLLRYFDHEFAHGRGRLGLTYFHNEFGNTLGFLSQTALISFGLPAAALTSVAGAYVNSLSYRTQGLEAQIKLQLGNHFFARGGYTLLDGKVQDSFASSALKPVYNTAYNFGSIPIGSSGPLKGNRPFRRARNSGYFGIQYGHRRFSTSLIATIVGLRDDSDFLTSDPNGKPNLLLPNQNLDRAYQRLELSGDYHVTSYLTAYTQIQNLLSQHYSEAFGYPALPLNFRAGFRVSQGGEAWKGSH